LIPVTPYEEPVTPASKTLWSAVATGSNAAFVFSLIPIITKLGGLRTYGLWEAFAVLVGLLAPVAWLGLRSGFTRYCAGLEDHKTLSANFHAVLLVVAPAALALGCLEWLASPVLARQFFRADPMAFPLLRVAAALIAAEAVRLIVLEFFRATMRIRTLGLLEGAQRIIEVALIVVVLRQEGTVVGCAAAVLAVRLSVIGIAYVVIVSQTGWARPDFTRILPYMTFGFPLLVNEFLGRALKVGDRFVIGHFLTMGDVGVYSVGVNLAMVFTLYTATLQIWLYPHLSGLWNQGRKEEAVRALERALRFFLLLCLPTLAGLAALGPQAAAVVSDPATAVRTAPIIPLVALGLMLYGVSALTLYALTLVERTAVISALLAGTVAINITLNVLLVPTLGILGAGIAHATSFSLLAITMTVAARRVLPVNPFPGQWFLPRVLASCVVMVCVVAVVGWVAPTGLPSLVVSILLGAAVYAGLVLGTRCVTIGEIRSLLGR